MKSAIILAALLLASGSVLAGDLQKARLLYESGLLDDAKRELVEVISSASSPSESADALYLLGSIAIEEERYESAVRTWEDLVRRFPGTRSATEAQGKLPLARRLQEQGAPSAPRVDPARSTIIVAGIGNEREFVNQTVTEIMNLLASKGVHVTRAPAATSSVPELLSQSDQAEGVLVLALRFGYMENLRAMCHGPNAELMWEERASGSTGFTKSGITQGLVRRISKKLEPHIGGSCLPAG